MVYCLNEHAESPIMLINKHIGMDEVDGQGVDGALFMQELMMLDAMGKKSINIWINSVGGVVLDAFNIVTAMLKSKTPCDTYCGGVAASSAGVVFMAGRKRTMTDYGLLMLHNPFGDGASKKTLDAMGQSLVTLIAAKSSLSDDDVKYLMDRTTWLTASECLDKGFATDIEVTRSQNSKGVTIPIPKQVPTGGNEVKAMWKECNLVLNSLLSGENNKNSEPQNFNNMSMTKVTNRLQLVEGANEEQIVDAIRKMEDRMQSAVDKAEQVEEDSARKIQEVENKTAKDIFAAKEESKAAKAAEVTAKDELATVKNTLVDTEGKLQAKTSEFDAIKAKYDAMKSEKEAQELAAKKAKAESLVNEHVKTGRIKNEAEIITMYKDMAEKDFDGTEKLINAIPLNSKMPQVVTEGQKQDLPAGTLPTNAMSYAVINKVRRQKERERAGW